MKNKTYLALICMTGISLIFLISCEKPITPQQATSIQSVMTHEEVRNMLGRPSNKNTKEIAGREQTILTYRHISSTVTVILVDGKVVNKSASFN